MLEWEDPGLLYNHLEEKATKTLNGFDELLPFELSHVELLGFDSDGIGGIGGDGLVVR